VDVLAAQGQGGRGSVAVCALGPVNGSLGVVVRGPITRWELAVAQSPCHRLGCRSPGCPPLTSS
jgi:hypothetical protein